jgi:hypothetical protein
VTRNPRPDGARRGCDDGGVSEPASSTTPQPSVPPRLVFRLPRVSLLAVLFVAVSASPVAWSAPWLWLLYLVPLAIAWWLVRTRTVVDSRRLAVRTALGRRDVPWSELTALRVADPATVRAVLPDQTEVRLPSVRARHLPLLSAMSGGRLPDPSAPATPDRATPDVEPDQTPDTAGDQGESVADEQPHDTRTERAGS